MKQKIKIIGSILTVLAFLVAVGFSYWQTREATGSAPIGLPTSVATVRTVQVGPSANTLLFAGASTTPVMCSSRVISTAEKAIMLKFATSSDGATSANSASSTEPVLWGYQGHIQAASTTVVYDSGLYGCDFWGAYGFDSTTTVTVTEFK